MSTFHVCAFLMNLDSSKMRLSHFTHAFGPHFTRVDAVHADEFRGVAYPCLPPHGHFAYKALTATMVKSMKTALRNETCSHAIIFEDDAAPPPRFREMLPTLLQENGSPDVLYLDARNGRSTVASKSIPGCCLMATLYNRDAMHYLSTALDWKTSLLMRFYARLALRNVVNPHCLNDWMHANFLGMTNLKVASHPVVRGHGKFASQGS